MLPISEGDSGIRVLRQHGPRSPFKRRRLWLGESDHSEPRDDYSRGAGPPRSLSAKSSAPSLNQVARSRGRPGPTSAQPRPTGSGRSPGPTVGQRDLAERCPKGIHRPRVATLARPTVAFGTKPNLCRSWRGVARDPTAPIACRSGSSVPRAPDRTNHRTRGLRTRYRRDRLDAVFIRPSRVTGVS